MKNLGKLLFFTFAFICSCLFMASCGEDKEAATLEVSASQVTVGKSGASFTVTSNTKWVISQRGSHRFPITPTSGDGGNATEVTIGYEVNETDETWNSVATITAGGIIKIVEIIQSKMEFAISPETLEFDAAGGDKIITVTSNTNWKIDNSEAIPLWITRLDASTSEGNGEIKVGVSENTSNKPRDCSINILIGSKSNKLFTITQQAAPNKAPSKPVITSPVNGATDVELTPTFTWDASTDEENDPIIYTAQISLDGRNYTTIYSGNGTTASFPEEMGSLMSGREYSFKVVADDSMGGITESDICKFTTSGDTQNYYTDGEYTLYMDSYKPNPYIIVFTGDGYLQEHHIHGGLFDQDMNAAIEAVFAIEPYKSYKEYFRVYKIAAYSNETGISNSSTGVYKNTAFKLLWEGGHSTGISLPSNSQTQRPEKVYQWVAKIPELANSDFKNMSVAIISNANEYAGTCWMRSDGLNVASMTRKQGGSGQTLFENTVRHELCGHGIGRLSDEYAVYETADQAAKDDIVTWQNYGVGFNISAFANISESPWAHFANITGYSHVGMYEGAGLYKKGLYRSEISSCMIDNRPYFNTASRFYIVKRILETAGEVQPFDSSDSAEARAAKIKALMDIFLAKDSQKTPNAAPLTRGWDGVPYDFRPLAPPVRVIR